MTTVTFLKDTKIKINSPKINKKNTIPLRQEYDRAKIKRL